VRELILVTSKIACDYVARKTQHTKQPMPVCHPICQYIENCMSAWLVCTTWSIKQHAIFYFCNNCGRCGLVWIILSLFFHSGELQKRLNKIYHLPSNLLLHYFGKMEYATATLKRIVQCICYPKLFIYSNCLSDMLISVSCVDSDWFTILKDVLKIVCLQDI